MSSGGWDSGFAAAAARGKKKKGAPPSDGASSDKEEPESALVPVPLTSQAVRLHLGAAAPHTKYAVITHMKCDICSANSSDIHAVNFCSFCQ